MQVIDFSFLCGMTVPEAKEFIKKDYPNKWICVVRIDKTNYMITCDLNFDRILVEVDNHIITNVMGCG